MLNSKEEVQRIFYNTYYGHLVNSVYELVHNDVGKLISG